jgi:hypothetical protein
MTEYQARCHCGALTARYRTANRPAEWPIRACQCSFCRAHGALSTSDPEGTLQFSCERPELLQRYRFGTGSTDFLICRACGVYVGAHTTREGNRIGVLNILAVVPIPSDLPQPTPMNYSGETAETRYQRRQGRWTPLTSDSL